MWYKEYFWLGAGKGKIKHYAMKTYGGSENITPPFLTSVLDWGEWLGVVGLLVVILTILLVKTNQYTHVEN
jgi:hypothetical protein